MNADTPFGFRLAGSYSGGERIESNLMPVDSSNATAFFRGDPVEAEADGKVKPGTAGAGVNITDVVIGMYDTDYRPLEYLPASTAGYLVTVPVKGRKFYVQSDSGTNVAETARFATADFVAGSGDTTTGRSAYELDSSNIGTGQQLRILGKAELADNSWDDEHVILEVIFVENAYEDNTSI